MQVSASSAPHPTPPPLHGGSRVSFCISKGYSIPGFVECIALIEVNMLLATDMITDSLYNASLDC